MSREHFHSANSHDALVQNIAHEIERRYQHGENLPHVLKDEIHHLRNSEYSHGHFNRQSFKHDLKQLEHKLQADHILPHIHIHTSGKHAGSIESIVPAKPTEMPRPAGHDAIAGAVNDAGRPTGNGELGQLKQDIDKARAAGKPINMVQIGDSHIAAGIETQALAQGLSNRFGVKVNYKADGINGAHTTDALANPGFFLKNLNKDTNLVVVSFGSNDADSVAGKAYHQNYEKLLSDIRTKAPNATLVMVGPTDGAYWKHPDKELVGLDSVTREQSAVAATIPHSGYFDIRAKLGTIAQMRSHAWMDDSNLHFTKEGYQVIGDSIAQFIENKVK
ncbi:MAG: hypothetical protein JSS86_07415 [Cyanobacteria bacterium SZAS LIN-2]|nr:hypothetical protein [Cyanobacteria bacterium SZAS LIN-3]MBS1996121.1 hypothetical protein [Cyanobacteria bacterium SZAS LIN-2]